MMHYRKSITKNIFCIFLVSLVINKSLLLAQAPTTIEPTLNAQQAVKAEDNISLYTGALNYTIPIFTIHDGDITIPIPLTYSGTGVKVNDVAPWYGLGWTLNAGGMVTRTVVGLPDEGDGISGYVNITFDRGQNSSIANYPNGNGMNDAGLEDSIGQGIIDPSPDVFNFFLPGASGQLVYDANLGMVASPFQNVWSSPGNGMMGVFPETNMLFSNNFNYTFSGATSITTVHIPTYNIYDVDGPVSWRDTTIATTNEWYLSDIYSWNNNDVSFSYDGFAYGTQVSENQRDTDIIFPLGTGNYNIPTQNAALSDYYRSEPHIQSINFPDFDTIIFV